MNSRATSSDVIWLVGAGGMAEHYAKVLSALGRSFKVIGRGDASARRFEEDTSIEVTRGGLHHHIQTGGHHPGFAIVAVGVDALSSITEMLLESGVQNILVEKPGAIDRVRLERLNELAVQKKASVVIAYNRRFYSSVRLAEKIIEEDGGVTSFSFDFTERSNIIATLQKPRMVLEHWFLSNSSHVVDLAFYLGGKPKELSTYVSGGTEWHPVSSVFAGAGVSDRDALFSYSANWDAPGGWGLEVHTNKHKLIFRPLEKLQIQEVGSAEVQEVQAADTLDTLHKPGVYLQTEEFLKGNLGRFCTLSEQLMTYPVYAQIAGYTSGE